MILNGSTRSLVGRLNTLSIRAIRQIFCRRKGKFSSRIGCCSLGSSAIATRDDELSDHLFGEIGDESFEFGDVARVESEEQVLDPFEFRSDQRIEDSVHQLVTTTSVWYEGRSDERD